MTAIAGFLLASAGQVSFGLLGAMVVGLSLVIGSACVFNNYIDRDIDRKMERTQKRALVKGTISGRNALAFGTVLGLAGVMVLGVLTNLLTLGVALVGVLVYVVLYAIGKRASVYGTLVGSVAGAVPPVVGYCAVTNQFDGGAIILFAILVLWQMPHFYAIAMYRLDDYAAASLPVLPVKAGLAATKRQILWYIAAFTVMVTALTVFGYTGYTYLIVATGLGLAWFVMGWRGLAASDDKLWARKMFKFSLIVLMTWSVLISAESVLP